MENNEFTPNLPMYTRDSSCAYQVQSGSVDISVVRDAGADRISEPEYLCTLEKGTHFPAYFIRTRNHVNWLFYVEAASDDAEISPLPAEMPEADKTAFLSKTPAAALLSDDAVPDNERFAWVLREWFDLQQMVQTIPDETEQILLRADSQLRTADRNVHYAVTGGSVNIFVEKFYGTARKRRFFLRELKAGEELPSLFYIDGKHNRMDFLILSAEGEATVVQRDGAMDESLKRRFLQLANITPVEGDRWFEESLDEWYTEKLLNISPIPVPKEESGLYKAVKYACEKMNISLYPEEDIRPYSGDEELTVPIIAKVSHFICRDIVLEPGWWNSDSGAVMGTIDGQSIACVPRGRRKYMIFYGDEEREEPLTAQIAENIQPKAFSISRTLPAGKLNVKDIIEFCKKSLNYADLTAVAVYTLLGSLIGLLLPTLNQKIYDDYIPSGDYTQLYQMCVVIGSFMLGNLFFSVVKDVAELRISSRVGYDLQNALIFRSFHLPEAFFRERDSADLAQRILQTDEIVTTYSNALLVSGIAFVTSLLYLIKIFKASSRLAWASIAMLALFLVVFFLLARAAARFQEQSVRADGEASARLYQFLRAIDKVRMAGAEARASGKYMEPVEQRERSELAKVRFLSFNTALKGVAVTLISMVMYWIMVKRNVNLTVGNFTAFNSAFGSFSSAVLNLMDSVISAIEGKPELDRLKPFFETEPEYSSGETRQMAVSSLNGSISLKDVSFSYSENSPMVLKNLNMQIDPGDYVGIVGRSGCGKSTLFKLLLGFEKPISGRIQYDGRDLAEMDKTSFRKKMGVVLQNGRLISGSIMENITITAPHATLQDVKDAVKAVGLEEDINNMPMGLHTMLNEMSGTISGGQMQRILIARAIIGKPQVLLLDEATSALDNLTQKTVCDSLDKIRATKIVIAHRLSTIQNCNKIFVLDDGRIVESGNHKELMAKKGLYYEMAVRQQAE